MNGLDRAVGYFTRETGIMDALCVAAGQDGRILRSRDGRDLGDRAVFDLASVTKLFTGLCLMRLAELGRLDLSARVTAYAPEFPGLFDVTVEQLAAFQVQVRTPARIDAQPDRESALRCLRASAVIRPESGGSFSENGAHYTPGHRISRFYSDIPAMILKYVIEGAAGESFFDCIREWILQPAGMRETWARVPQERRADCLLYGPEYRIEKEKYICRTDPLRGVPHDPKAAVLQGSSGDLCGHAGLFSTMEDLIRFCRAVLAEKIVTRETLARMAVNRTGRRMPDGTWSQFLGYQCYVKHPDQYFSEIPASMSPSAFGIGGFTGCHLSVDPARNRFTIMLGNRVRDRLTVLLPEAGKTLEDYGLRPDGTGRVRWPDGSEHLSSVNYVHQKDAHLHRAVDEAFRLCRPKPAD